MDQGACVCREGDYAPAISDTTKFMELMDKRDQLRDLLSKRAYAKEKELEQVSAMNP